MAKVKSLSLSKKADNTAVLPHPLRVGWDQAQNYPEQALEAIHRNLVDVESGKSKSDPKVLLKGYLKDLHDWSAKMKLVINAVKAL
jgi:hypothetical protein